MSSEKTYTESKVLRLMDKYQAHIKSRYDEKIKYLEMALSLQQQENAEYARAIKENESLKENLKNLDEQLKKCNERKEYYKNQLRQLETTTVMNPTVINPLYEKSYTNKNMAGWKI